MEISPAHFLTLDCYRSWMEDLSSLQSVPVVSDCRSKPDGDGCVQTGNSQQLLRQVELFLVDTRSKTSAGSFFWILSMYEV